MLARANAFSHSPTMEKNFLSAPLLIKAFRGARRRIAAMELWKSGRIAFVQVSSLAIVNQKETQTFFMYLEPTNFSSQPPLSSPPAGEKNGTCPSSLIPSATLTFGTVAATIVSSTTASTSAAGTMFRAASSAVSPYTTEASPINLKSAAPTMVSPTTTFFTGTPVSSKTAMVVATTMASNAASSATVFSGTVAPTRLTTPINQSSLPTFDASPALQSRFPDSTLPTGQAASQSTSSLSPTPSVTSSPSNQIPTSSVTPIPGRKTDRSGLYVGVGVGVGVLVLAIAVVVVVLACRGKRKSGGYNLKDQGRLWRYFSPFSFLS